MLKNQNKLYSTEMNPQEKKTRRFFPILLTLAALILTLGITTIYFKGLQHSSLFPSNILVLTLVNVNLILVVLLVLLLSRNLIKLYFERRHKLLGATFRIKLISAFIGLSLIPSILLFIVASKLLTDSIENWFSSQIEHSMNVSLEVAQTYYQEAEASTFRFADKIAEGLVKQKLLFNKDGRGIPLYLKERRDEFSLDSIGVYSTGLDLAGTSEIQQEDWTMRVPLPEELLWGALKGDRSARILTIPNGDLVQVFVPMVSLSGGKEKSVAGL